MDENPQRPSTAPAPEGNAPKAERAWKALAFFAAVFALAAFRLALQASLPVHARPSSGHDDLLLANYAANWAAGNAWGPYFGDYLATALEKLPGFSLFLGVGRKIGVPFPCGSDWRGFPPVSPPSPRSDRFSSTGSRQPPRSPGFSFVRPCWT